MTRAELTPLTVAGPAGTLEALIEAPHDAYTDAVAIVCHPHPLYHGTMNNKVVHTITRAVNLLHRPAIRFNFRGVGESSGEYTGGEGETEDALAVIRWARNNWPSAELWLAGFSFGAFIALRCASRASPACLITVAPPIHRFAVAEEPRPGCPWLIVHGDSDELVDCGRVSAWSAELRPPPTVEILENTDHYFHGRLTRLREIVHGFLSSQAPACEVA